MWETGTIITLVTTRGHCHHHEFQLDLLVDASFANGTSRPLLLSLPSRPFARLRPPFSSRGRQKQQQRQTKKKQKKQTRSEEDGTTDGNDAHVPIAIDGRAVGKEALWSVRSVPVGVGTTAVQDEKDATSHVAIESVAHPGVFLSVDECGRVSCLKRSSSSEDAMGCCVFHAKISDPTTQTQTMKCTSPSISSTNTNTCEIRCEPTPASQHHPRFDSTSANADNTIVCDASICGSTTTHQPPWKQPRNECAENPCHWGPLSHDQILQFATDGYLVLRAAVPPRLWRPAAASVFGALGRPGAVVPGGDGSNSGHRAAGKLDGRYVQTPQMRALLGTDSVLASCAAQLMTATGSGGGGRERRRMAGLADAIDISQTSAQVALRFPEPSLLGLRGVAVPEEDGLWASVPASCTIRECAEGSNDETVADGRREATERDAADGDRELQAEYLRDIGVRWHIDGTRQRQYHGFTLLMGVALSDCGLENSGRVVRPSELEGQLCVWPRSHWHLQGMGKMCDPKPVDYASLVRSGAPLDCYEYFDYLDSADASSQARSMKYLDAAAVDSVSQMSKSTDNMDNTTNNATSLKNNSSKNTTTNPICSSSPGGIGPSIVSLKAGDGVLLHCETAHAATPNFHPSKVRAMAYYRLRLLPRPGTDDPRQFRGEADRRELRECYEWGVEYDRASSSVDGAIGDASVRAFAPGAIAAAKSILASLWPDLGGVRNVLSEYVDGMVCRHWVGTNKPEEEAAAGVGALDEENKKAGLDLLRICNLHPRSPAASVY